MQTFSKRNDLKNEYSGYCDASQNLRNRLLLLYGLPYSGNEYQFGLGNDNWIHEVEFSRDLHMHFGRQMHIDSFRDVSKTSFEDVFDFIELYFARAKADLESSKRMRLFRDIVLAFQSSGSVYEFSRDGEVILKIDDITADNITSTDKILSPLQDANSVYRDCVNGLLTRSKLPKDVVGDMYIVFEEYLKKSTNSRSADTAIKFLKTQLMLHSTQTQILEKLKAYRGDVWGVAHAGNSPQPKEEDALWYLESIITMIKYIDIKIKL